MIIQPKIRGFICTTAHPKGCAESVRQQIEYVKSQGQHEGPKNVLVIGASTGYGLASRIAATYGSGAKTLGVFYEKEPDAKRTASPGWYNTAAFEEQAHTDGFYAKSINGDAFSQAIKQQAIDAIRNDMGKVDLVIYSLASPRRTHPKSGTTYSSVLKPIGQSFTGKSVDAFRGEVKEVTIEPATDEEIANTITVMGGEDWQLWIDALQQADLLAEGVTTVAYSYIGPELTHAIYKDGTIGKAKEDLKRAASEITNNLASLNGEAVVTIAKAVVTQASAAIPVVPLYISLLFKIMKEQGTHEGCIEQMDRMFRQHLYADNAPARDAEGYIRIDDLEMQNDVQQEVARLWEQVNSENVNDMTDIEGYRNDFYQLFGFNMSGVNYEDDTDQIVGIESLKAKA